MAIDHKSTRQLLEKITNYPSLYRHTTNGTYYGIKKIGGKRKEHSLQTDDRKIAERKLSEWIKTLGQIDSEAEKTNLSQLIEKFDAATKGKSDSTRATNDSIIKRFKEEWRHGLDIRVSKIKPSYLGEWLARHEGRIKNTTYNRYCCFLKQLFDIAVCWQTTRSTTLFSLMPGDNCWASRRIFSSSSYELAKPERTPHKTRKHKINLKLLINYL